MFAYLIPLVTILLIAWLLKYKFVRKKADPALAIGFACAAFSVYWLAVMFYARHFNWVQIKAGARGDRFQGMIANRHMKLRDFLTETSENAILIGIFVGVICYFILRISRSDEP